MARVAFLLDRMDEAAGLSPFFSKARWLLVFDTAAGDAHWSRNRDGRAERLCGLIRDAAPEVLVCGWIDDVSLQAVRAAGIDVRVGPCTVSALSLLGRLNDLPRPPADLRAVK